MNRKLALFIPLVALCFPGLALAKSPGAWREVEKQGLGIGYIEAHYGDGLKVFYNYTPLSFLQLHLDLYETTILSFLNNEQDPIETHSAGGALSLRVFPVSSWGWFVGWGRGQARVHQEVAPHLSARGNPDPVRSTGSYATTFLELGWQGWEGFYLTVNLQRGKSHVQKESNLTPSIMDPEVRDLAGNAFEQASSIIALHLGFGWHL